MNLIDYCMEKNLKIKVFLFSMEVVSTAVICKMLTYKIYKEHGIILEPDYILSRGKHKPSKQVLDLIDTYTEYFDKLENSGILEIHDTPQSPYDIKIKVENYAVQNGYYDRDKGKYTPRDPNEYVIILTDTVGNLIDTERNRKATIDLHSANCRSLFRDTFNYIPINISHANRAISDPARARTGEVFPVLSDIKETNMLEQDSSVVMCLFNPYKHLSTFKNLANFMDYDINTIRGRFRCIGVLKNRHGKDNMRIGLSYYGECGAFESIKRGHEMTIDDYKEIVHKKANIIPDKKGDEKKT